MFALFGLMERASVPSERRGGALGYLSLFFAALSLYVFFDNSLSLVAFDSSVAAKINTIGVAACAFFIFASYVGFISSVLGIPTKRAPWLRLATVLALLAVSLTFLVIEYGWEWYMERVDRYAIGLFALVFLILTVKQCGYFIARKAWRERTIFILISTINVMVLSLFFWKVLITSNPINFALNNSLPILAIAFLYPLLFRVYRSAEYREIMRMRAELGERALAQSRSLKELFSVRQTPAFSDREIEVCEALLRGLEYKEIALETGLSLSGVKKRVHSIYSKFGIQNRTELTNLIASIRASTADGTIRADDASRPKLAEAKRNDH